SIPSEFVISFVCIFFFSSRRRHTRFSRDWSSDVCSSDLSLYATDDKLATEVITVLNKVGSVSWASGNHSAAYIPVFAIGAGSDVFTHKMENTDIPRKVAEVAGWSLD